MDIIIKQDTIFKKNLNGFSGTEQAKDLPVELTLPVKKGTLLKDIKAITFKNNHYLVTLNGTLGKYNTWSMFRKHIYISKSPLLTKLIRRYITKNYQIFDNKNELNIFGIENYYGTQINEYNDLIGLFKFEEENIVAPFLTKATTTPGIFYTLNPMNSKGAANLRHGQYTAWKFGNHTNYEALVQVKPVIVSRDLNKDFSREGDKEDTGLFGINIHHGYSSSLVGKNSAGCQVIQSIKAFKSFLRFLKGDARYLKDRDFIFTYTLVDNRDLHI